MWPCTDAGLSLPFRRSSLPFRAEYESACAGLCVKDCERFLRGLSSKNSMMKACWVRGSWSPCLGASFVGDGARGVPWDRNCSATTGEAVACLGGEYCSGCWSFCVGGDGGQGTDGTDWMLRGSTSDCSDWTACCDWADWWDLLLRPLRTGSSESLWVPSS